MPPILSFHLSKPPSLLPHLPHNGRLQRLLIRPHHLPDLLPVLENQKRRHRPDAQLLRNIGHLVDIQFVETSAFLVFLRHGDDGGGDDFAGAAPGGEAVEDHEGGVGEGGAEVGGTGGGVSWGDGGVGCWVKIGGGGGEVGGGREGIESKEIRVECLPVQLTSSNYAHPHP